MAPARPGNGTSATRSPTRRNEVGAWPERTPPTTSTSAKPRPPRTRGRRHTTIHSIDTMRAATATVLLYVLSFGVAAHGIVAYSLMPIGSFVHPDMKPAFVAHPLGVYVHVFAAAVALLLGPFQFSARLQRTRLQLHRWGGARVLGLGCSCGGSFRPLLVPVCFRRPRRQAWFRHTRPLLVVHGAACVSRHSATSSC
jgi:hypothetical protein